MTRLCKLTSYAPISSCALQEGKKRTNLPALLGPSARQSRFWSLDMIEQGSKDWKGGKAAPDPNSVHNQL